MKNILKLLILTVVFTSCSKDLETKNETPLIENSENKKATLLELFNSLEGQVGDELLTTLPQIDNSKGLMANFTSKVGMIIVDGYPKWGAMYYWGGCQPCPAGYCLLTPDPFGDPMDPWFGQLAHLSTNGDNLLLDPQTSINGYTVDGFLPVLEDTPVDSEICDQLGISHTSMVQAGVYTVNQNQNGEYTSVLLNLVE